MSRRFAQAAVVGMALVSVSAMGWLVTPAPAQAPQASRVGYVDLQRILARSQAGMQAREQLEKEKVGMQKQLDGHKVELDKLRDELEKKGQLLSADARRDKQDQLERKLRDAQRLAGDLEKELQKKEQTMGTKILRELEGIFTKVGKEKGYAVILERRQAGVVYGAPEVDVTEEVIKAFDDETRKAKK
jgi:outer membrane protein